MSLAALLTILLLAPPYWRAASFIVRAAGVTGVLGRWARWDLLPVSEEPLTIAGRRHALAARLYRPARPTRRTLLVFAGVHPAGLDEPRLVALARELAQSGFLVVTPELTDLVHLDIAPGSVDDIEDATAWTASQERFAADGRVGLLGISFSGSLAIVAAGRPAIRDRVAFVLSFGGHGDLPRVLRYLCTGDVPGSNVHRTPHDYGVAVVLYGLAAAMVPPDQVAPLRQVIAGFVWASHLDTVDRLAAIQAFADSRAAGAQLPEPARSLLQLVNDRRAEALGRELLPRLGTFGADASLSPEQSPVPAAPVYLLHGLDDRVIPSEESVHLGQYLRAHSVRTRLLLSPLISHAEVDRPATLPETLALVRFWGDMLGR